MNWTGGKLNRHAKSYSSDKLKAQRTFFAQASRTRTIPRISLDPSIETIVPLQSRQSFLSEAHHQEHKITSLDNPPQGRQFPDSLLQDVQADLGTSHHLSDAKSLAQNQLFTTELLNGYAIEAEAEASGTSPHPRDAAEPATVLEMPNSMKEMKKKLLDQSDWLGLSFCRPVNIKFAPPEDMAKIGRHRRGTQLKDQDDRQPPNKKDQQYTTKPLIGKRKRSAQDDHSSPPDGEGRASGEVSQEQVDNRPPRRLLEDPNRRFYVLANDEADLDITPKDLLSLEEAKEFGSFDAVRGKHLESKQKDHMPKSSEANKMDNTGRASKARTTQSRNIPTFGLNKSEFITQGFLPKATLDSPISLNHHNTPLEHVGNCSTDRLCLTRFGDNDANQQAVPVVLSEKPHTKSPIDLPALTLRESGVAVRDFAFTAEVLRGKHNLQVTDPDASKHAIDRTWPSNFTRTATETSLSPSSTNTSQGVEIPAQVHFKTQHCQKSVVNARPRVRFQLDEIYGRESENVLKFDHDTLLEKHGRNMDRNEFSDAVLSPHFLHTASSDTTFQKRDPVTSSRLSTNTQGEANEGLIYGGTDYVNQNCPHGVLKRSFTGAFPGSPTDGYHSVTSSLPPLCTTSPMAKPVQLQLWTCDQTSSVNSRSS